MLTAGVAQQQTPTPPAVARTWRLDCGRIGSGPGQIRDFPADAKFAPPQQHYELGPQKTPRARSQETGALAWQTPRTEAQFRTLDYSRLNEGLHNWSRADTFQTPFGHISGPKTEATYGETAATPPTPSTDVDVGVKELAGNTAEGGVLDPSLLLDLAYKVNRCLSTVDELQGDLKQGLDELRAQAAASSMSRQLEEFGHGLSVQLSNELREVKERAQASQDSTNTLSQTLQSRLVEVNQELKNGMLALRHDLTHNMEQRLKEIFQESFEQHLSQALELAAGTQKSADATDRDQEAVAPAPSDAQPLAMRLEDAPVEASHADELVEVRARSKQVLQDAVHDQMRSLLLEQNETVMQALAEIRAEIKECVSAPGAVDFSFVDFSMLTDDIKQLLEEHVPPAVEPSAIVEPTVKQILENLQPVVGQGMGALRAQQDLLDSSGRSIATVVSGIKGLSGSVQDLQQQVGKLPSEFGSECGLQMSRSPLLLELDERIRTLAEDAVANQQLMMQELHSMDSTRTADVTSLREDLQGIPRDGPKAADIASIKGQIEQLRQTFWEADATKADNRLRSMQQWLETEVNGLKHAVSSIDREAHQREVGSRQDVGLVRADLRSAVKEAVLELNLPGQLSGMIPQQRPGMDVSTLAELLQVEVAKVSTALEERLKSLVTMPPLPKEAPGEQMAELRQHLMSLEDRISKSWLQGSGELGATSQMLKKSMLELQTTFVEKRFDVDVGKLSLVMKEFSGKTELARILDELRKIHRQLNITSRLAAATAEKNSIALEAALAAKDFEGDPGMKYFSLVVEENEAPVSKLDFAMQDGEELRVPINTAGVLASGVVAPARPASAGSSRRCGLPARAFRVLANSPRDHHLAS